MKKINGIKITGLQEKPVGFDRERLLEGYVVYFNDNGETPYAYIKNNEGSFTKLTDERDVKDQLPRIKSLISHIFQKK
jgi:hypothetical protein